MVRDANQQNVEEERVDRNATVTYETEHDEGVAEAVMAAVSSVLNRDPIELEPLYSVVDPEALDELFQPNRYTDRAGGLIEFTYSNCEITVRIHESITIEVRTEPDPGTRTVGDPPYQ